MTYGSLPVFSEQVQVAVAPFPSITHGASRQNAHGRSFTQLTKLVTGK